MLQPHIFLFLVADVLTDQRFIPPYRGLPATSKLTRPRGESKAVQSGDCCETRMYARLVPSIQLRNVSVDDISTLFDSEIDPESNRMAAVVPRDFQAFYEHWLKILNDPNVIAKAILVDGQLAGDIGCFKAEGREMIGYRIAREYWGMGVATRALELLLELVTRRPLHARVAIHNRASIRVLEKCGFTIVGHERSPATERFLECEEAILTLR
jgi:RimJ/RimL family protein N-acetyltransferase